jgi:hypothetical protein
MEIEQQNEGHKGHFRANDQGKTAGLMTYTWAGSEKFIIDHTEVDPAYKGQNVGKQMVMAAVEFARQNNLRILPLCPFAKSVFDRNPEIRDVL